MLNLLLRPIIGLAGIITGWFVATDTLRFTVVQTIIGMLLAVGLMAVAAFWPESWTRKLSGRKPEEN